MKMVARLLAALALAAPLFAASQRPLIVTTQDHSLVTVDDCDHFYARTSSSFPAEAMSREQRPITLEGVPKLRVRGSLGGGISIKGWDRPVARLTVCKYAVALTDADASKLLREVAVSSSDGMISAEGPQIDESGAWWVHMILRVPRRAALDVASNNGGIAIRNMDGKVDAHATNGGISIASITGEARVSTDNGGITIAEITGRVEAMTENGTISLRLKQGEHASIEARTDDDNDILCRAKICETATASQAGGSRVLRIGAAQPTIRLNAGSAPILIEQVR